MIKKIFFLFLFFAPFTSFFAISAWLRLPVIVNQVLFLIILTTIIIQGKLKNKWILKEDLLLIGVLLLVWLSFLLGYLEQRSFNHSLAYTNSILFYFFLSKYIIKLLKVSTLEISKIIYKSFLACSIIIIIDFLGKNYFDFSLREWFSTVGQSVSNMNYFIRGGMFRVAGVGDEPGHMAFFYNIYFGISLYYITNKGNSIKKKWIIIGVFFFCHFALYSSAGMALCFIAVALIFCINKLKKAIITKKQLFLLSSVFIAAILVLPILILTGGSSFRNEFGIIFDKITFNENPNVYTSSGARLDQWSRAITNFASHPIFGNGPGYGVHEDPEGYLSVYLTILSDIGIFAFLFFILFEVVLIKKVLILKKPNRNFLLFSVITSFLHLIIISDFYHAPIWILFVFIQLIYGETKLKKV